MCQTSVTCHRDDSACRRHDRDSKQYPMDFEGTPPQHSKLRPGQNDHFELMYGASWGRDASYAVDFRR